MIDKNSKNGKSRIEEITAYLQNMSAEILNLGRSMKEEDVDKFLKKIKQDLNVEIDRKLFLKEPTMENIINQIKNIAFLRNRAVGVGKIRLEKQFYVLSNAQKRMFVLYKLEPRSTLYTLDTCISIRGPLDVRILEKSLNKLVKRHESLRTNFFKEKGELVQKINEPFNLKVNYHDLSRIKNKKERKKAEELLREKEKNTPFKLESDRLIRVLLLKRKSKDYILIFSIHHIILDGWSIDIIYNELTEIYKSLLKNKKPNLPKLEIQYKDYATWEQSKENKRRLKKQEEFWLEELSGDLPILNLPLDKPRPVIQTHNGDVEQIILDKEVTRRLKELGKKNDATLFAVLFTVFNVFLHRVTGQNDLIVGTLTANRNYEEIQNVLGCFINNLSIRTKLSRNLKFSELLETSKQKIITATNNGEYPFEDLIDKLNPERDMSRSPIFNVMFQIILRERALKRVDDLMLETRQPENNIAKFDMKMKAEKISDGSIILLCEYNTDLFKKETAKRFLRVMETLIDSTIKDPNKKIDELEIIPKEDKKLLNQFNNTKVEYPKSKTIHRLFEEQVKKTPKENAVEFEGKKITYEELNKKINNLTRIIVSKKIKKGDRVGIYLKRSEESIITELAILKAGAICVPLDITYPKTRLNYIAKDAKINLIITEKTLKKDSDKVDSKIEKIVIDKISQESKKTDKEKKDKEKENKEKEELDRIISRRKIKATDLAYLMYTSGSTGDPKGVKLNHRGIVNQSWHRAKKIRVNKKDIFAHTVSTGFVSSIIHWYVPLFIGAKVVIYNEEQIVDPISLFKAIEKDKVSFVEVIASTLRGYLTSIDTDKKPKLKQLKFLLISGEQTIASTVNKFFSHYKHITLINGCGQCECSALTLHYTFKEARTDYEHAPIGKPISNTKVYVLDKNLKPVVKGVEGELCISGDGLAEGYLNKPDKTKEVFVNNPFEKGKKLYRTGDIVKMLQDNNLVYLRRSDHQVQIRGYRVELGEIESRLASIEGVKECRVLTQEDKTGDTYLVAYYTGKKIKQEELKNNLKKQFPSYMIPNYFMYLEKFPKNVNGKIDIPNLPKPTEKDLQKKAYKEPITETEKKLAKIWQEVLGIEKVGLNDSFFDLGGHSLKAIQVLSRINKEFKIDLSLKVVFECEELENLSNRIENSLIEKNI